MTGCKDAPQLLKDSQVAEVSEFEGWEETGLSCYGNSLVGKHMQPKP